MSPSVEQRVMAILYCCLPVAENSLTPDTKLAELDVDSLALMEMLLMLGEVLDIAIGVIDMTGIYTVADLCDMVDKKIPRPS